MAKTRALDETLGQMHEALAVLLLNKIKEGTASAQEMAAAIKFLKDNNITSAIEKGSPLANLREQFPVFNDDEETV